MSATHELEFFDLDLEQEDDRSYLKQLYTEGWRLLWPEKMLTNDGKRDFCRHLVIMEREIVPGAPSPEPPPPPRN